MYNDSTFPNAFRHYKPRSKKVSGVIVISKENNILLVKGREKNKWSFPKGHLKGNETIHQCALRECYEETGLVLNNHNYTATSKLASGEYYVYRNIDEVFLKTHDSNEICDLGWISLASMMNLRTNVDVSAFLKIYQAYF